MLGELNLRPLPFKSDALLSELTWHFFLSPGLSAPYILCPLAVFEIFTINTKMPMLASKVLQQQKELLPVGLNLLIITSRV